MSKKPISKKLSQRKYAPPSRFITGQNIKYQKQELFNVELMDYEKAINSL